MNIERRTSNNEHRRGGRDSTSNIQQPTANSRRPATGGAAGGAARRLPHPSILSSIHSILSLVTASLLLLVSGCDRHDAPPVFRIAYTAGPSELLHHAAVRIASNATAASGGALDVRVYPGGQLGNERELTEGLKLRTVDMVISGLAIVGWYAPEFGVFEAPFVWRDYAHVESVWDGPIGADLRRVMQDRAGIRLLRPWFRGPRYLTTSTKKVLTPEDLRGMKLRVPELEVYIKAWQAFGANVTPIPFTDIFMALRLGVVEGQENPLATISANHLDEVQRYAMETRHLIGFYVPALGPSFERRFSPREREWVLAAFDEATRWHNLEVERMEADYRRTLEAGGMEFVPIDAEPFREIARRQIPPLFADIWKPGLYEAISAGR